MFTREVVGSRTARLSRTIRVNSDAASHRRRRVSCGAAADRHLEAEAAVTSTTATATPGHKAVAERGDAPEATRPAAGAWRSTCEGERGERRSRAAPPRWRFARRRRWRLGRRAPARGDKVARTRCAQVATIAAMRRARRRRDRCARRRATPAANRRPSSGGRVAVLVPRVSAVPCSGCRGRGRIMREHRARERRRRRTRRARIWRAPSRCSERRTAAPPSRAHKLLIMSTSEPSVPIVFAPPTDWTRAGRGAARRRHRRRLSACRCSGAAGPELGAEAMRPAAARRRCEVAWFWPNSHRRSLLPRAARRARSFFSPRHRGDRAPTLHKRHHAWHARARQKLASPRRFADASRSRHTISSPSAHRRRLRQVGHAWTRRLRTA